MFLAKLSNHPKHTSERKLFEYMCLSQTDLVYFDFILIPGLCCFRLSQEKCVILLGSLNFGGPYISFSVYIMNLTAFCFLLLLLF